MGARRGDERVALCAEEEERVTTAGVRGGESHTGEREGRSAADGEGEPVESREPVDGAGEREGDRDGDAVLLGDDRLGDRGRACRGAEWQDWVVRRLTGESRKGSWLGYESIRFRRGAVVGREADAGLGGDLASDARRGLTGGGGELKLGAPKLGMPFVETLSGDVRRRVQGTGVEAAGVAVDGPALVGVDRV